MPRLWMYLLAGTALSLVACDDGGAAPTDPDAAPGLDAGGDSVANPCYREADDSGNGIAAEPTGLGVGVGPVAICGQVDIGHPGGLFLDVDQYDVAVTVTSPVLLRLTMPGAASLDRVDLLVRNAGGRVALARVNGGLGVAVLPLAAGTHTIVVETQGAASAPLTYRVEVVDDAPALRCAIDGSPGPDTREPDESAAGYRANDTVSVRTSPALITQLTAWTGDAPVNTGLAVSTGGRKVISGVSADVPSIEDAYHDRDTFAIYTGQSTNLLEVRAVWPGTAADLDLYVFEADHADDPMGNPAQVFTGELLVTAVKPSTLYWVWVGASTRSSQLSASYLLSICGHEVAIGL